MENNMNISENKPERKKVIFSGIQPTSGAFTLGNYLGAVKNWGLLQDEYNCTYCMFNQQDITSSRTNPLNTPIISTPV